MTLHYLITKDDYETTLKTIQLDHSYSNIKLNNRCKHFPTVYLFKQTSNTLNIDRNTEISLQSLEDNAIFNQKISEKYFDITSSMEKIAFLEQWAYIAKLCNKDYEGLVLNKKYYKNTIKKISKIVKNLTLKVKSQPANDSMEYVAYRMVCIHEAYYDFVSNLSHLPLPKVHECMVRRLHGNSLASYLSLLQVFFHNCPSSCFHLMKSLKKKMPEETCELLHILLKTPCDLVHKPLPALTHKVNFIVMPDYMTPLTKDPLKNICKILRVLGKVKKIKQPTFVNNFQKRVGRNFLGDKDDKVTNEEMIMTYLRYVVSAVENKVKEVKQEKIPIVLICQNNTSLFSSLMSLANITAVICLGLPISEEHQNNITMKAPTLFIIGQNHLPMKYLETLTRSANHSTGLVLVEGADSNLNLYDAFKRHYSLTQKIADVLIANLARDFIAHVLDTNS